MQTTNPPRSRDAASMRLRCARRGACLKARPNAVLINRDHIEFLDRYLKVKGKPGEALTSSGRGLNWHRFELP